MSRLSPGAGPIAMLVNPTAGRGRGAHYSVPVAARLSDAGFEVQVLVGYDGRDAQRLAHQAVAEGCQALVVIGGDGMVHIGVNAAAGTGTPLGVVPAGTGNDFARATGLPAHRPDDAADLILGLEPSPVDVGRVGDAWFGCVLSAGFDSMVNERANRMTWPRGQRRYDIAMVLELGVFRAVPFRLTLDGQVVETEAMLVAVGNAASYGGGMKVCPGARLDDGRFYVTVLERISKPEFLRVFPQVYSGRHVNHPRVQVHEVSEVSLEAPGVVAYADGERLRPLPLRATTVPGGLQLLTPALA
jgi:diacylglycerol kinase (ATP)